MPEGGSYEIHYQGGEPGSNATQASNEGNDKQANQVMARCNGGASGQVRGEMIQRAQ